MTDETLDGKGFPTDSPIARWAAATAEGGKETEEQAERTKAQEKFNDDNEKLEKDKKPGLCYWASRKLADDARELAKDAVRKLAEAAAGVESPQPTRREK